LFFGIALKNIGNPLNNVIAANNLDVFIPDGNELMFRGQLSWGH